MRRPILLATCVLALAVIPVFAQHAGVHDGFVNEGGVGRWRLVSYHGMHAGENLNSPRFLHSSGFRARRRLNWSFGGYASRDDAFLRNRAFQRNRFHRLDHDNDDFRFAFHNCFRFSCRWVWGWPWWWGWHPWWWDADSSYDQNQERELDLANEVNRQSFEQRREQQQEYQQSNERWDPEPRRRQDAEPEPRVSATVLVFRDQHVQEILNYAIMGSTLWAFAQHHTQKISLTDLDVPATIRVNDDRGVDFRVPDSEVQMDARYLQRIDNSPTATARDVVLPAGTLLQCTLNEPNFSLATVAVGDPVLCHLRGIVEFGQQVFPRGSYLVGHLESAKDPGHFVGKGYLKLVFDRIGLPTGDLPLDAKVVTTSGYRVDREGKIDGKGHAKRDVAEWMLPPLQPWKAIMLPARGPRPKLKGESMLTLRLLDDVQIPSFGTTLSYH